MIGNKLFCIGFVRILNFSMSFLILFVLISLFISQGLLVLLSSIIAPYINDTVINDITCVGSLIIILIGTNLMGITKIKVADFLPAILFSPVIYYISDFVIKLFNKV